MLSEDTQGCPIDYRYEPGLCDIYFSWLTKGAQMHVWGSRRNNQQTSTQVNWDYQVWETEKKKNEVKRTHLQRLVWHFEEYQRSHNGNPIAEERDQGVGEILEEIMAQKHPKFDEKYYTSVKLNTLQIG